MQSLGLTAGSRIALLQAAPGSRLLFDFLRQVGRESLLPDSSSPPAPAPPCFLLCRTRPQSLDRGGHQLPVDAHVDSYQHCIRCHESWTACSLEIPSAPLPPLLQDALDGSAKFAGYDSCAEARPP